MSTSNQSEFKSSFGEMWGEWRDLLCTQKKCKNRVWYMQLQGIFWHEALDKTKHLKEECKKA
jgi:hypothetical protein